jgi:hypothetical protein
MCRELESDSREPFCEDYWGYRPRKSSQNEEEERV